jgi:hypothetical protein
MPSAPSRQACANYSRAIVGDLFVEQNAYLGAQQQSRQSVLAVEKGAIPQILTITLDQVECIEDRSTHSLPPTQLIEPG